MKMADGLAALEKARTAETEFLRPGYMVPVIQAELEQADLAVLADARRRQRGGGGITGLLLNERLAFSTERFVASMSRHWPTQPPHTKCNYGRDCDCPCPWCEVARQ